jgi:hypothetical protein
MRAAIIVNPAKSDVADLREQVDKTLAAAGLPAHLGRLGGAGGAHPAGTRKPARPQWLPRYEPPIV